MANAMDANAMDANAMGANEMTIEIHPQRLVWISMGNNCMFCPNPQGQSYITYVALESKVGYISCGECREKMSTAAEFWRTHRAYGQANHLKGRSDLKIRRSNGLIECGWSLNNPLVKVETDGAVTIHCYNAENNLERWCQMKTLLELNQ